MLTHLHDSKSTYLHGNTPTSLSSSTRPCSYHTPPRLHTSIPRYLHAHTIHAYTRTSLKTSTAPYLHDLTPSCTRVDTQQLHSNIATCLHTVSTAHLDTFHRRYFLSLIHSIDI